MKPRESRTLLPRRELFNKRAVFFSLKIVPRDPVIVELIVSLQSIYIYIYFIFFNIFSSFLEEKNIERYFEGVAIWRMEESIIRNEGV